MISLSAAGISRQLGNHGMKKWIVGGKICIYVSCIIPPVNYKGFKIKLIIIIVGLKKS
jgi:hypothetical protein